MQYPLYYYYKNRDMNLDEIIDHYVTRFYAKKHDGKAVLNVLNKVRNSSKIKNLCGQSATRRLAPNYVDFITTINEMVLFMFRSNMTQALAVLFAALYWDEKINSVYHLKTDEELRDDIIKVFKKLSIYEEMTEEEYRGGKNDNKLKEQSEETSKSSDILQKQQNVRSPKDSSKNQLKENFDTNESFKKHALTYMILRPETTFLCKDENMATLWAYIDKNLFCDQENASTMGAGAFMWLMQKYQDKEAFCWILDLLNKESTSMWPHGIAKTADELIADIKQYIPNFKLGNDPEKVKTSLQWAWIDIQSLLVFFKFCTLYSSAVLQGEKVVVKLRDCSSMAQLTRLYLSDFNVTGKGIFTGSDGEKKS